MQTNRVAPIWQRVVCGVLCVGGMLALPFNILHGDYHGWHGAALILLAVGGVYWFGHIALRGRLPGRVPGTEYVRFRHRSSQRNT